MRLRGATSRLLGVLWLLFVVGCGSTGSGKRGELVLPQKLSASGVVATELGSLDDFYRFSDDLAGERFVKGLVDLRSDSVYYFDVNVYPLHSDFIFAELYKEKPSPEGLARYLRNYDEDKPEFIVFYLVHHLAQDIWALAFYEGDRFKPEHLRKVWSKLGETFFAADKLRFRPDSDWQESVARATPEVPVVTNAEIYTQTTYKAFNEGEAVGRLRVVGPEDEEGSLTFERDDIVIVTRPIATISVVAGMISENFTTPLSHLSLRARAWGVPHIGIKNAAVRYRDLIGKPVYLRATEANFTLREASEDELADWQASRATERKVVVPAADLKERALRSLVGLRAKQANAYGAKAANLGEIATAGLDGVVVPAGVAVPIVYYREHLKQAGLTEQVSALLADPEMAAEPEYRAEKLEALREAIAGAPVDGGLLDRLQAALADAGIPTTAGVFVRSSTNAEDLPGFNGAGLYDTVPNVVGREALGKALASVWASVWNLRAWDERTFYGIDQSNVFGAVLVQTGIDARSAGVLVTADVNTPSDRKVYTINATRGLGIRVVDGKHQPEQLLFDWESGAIREVSRSRDATKLVFDEAGGTREVSDERSGKRVLDDAAVEGLVKAARDVTTLFPPDAPLDIEWAFAASGLQILQARPFVYKPAPGIAP